MKIKKLISSRFWESKIFKRRKFKNFATWQFEPLKIKKFGSFEKRLKIWNSLKTLKIWKFRNVRIRNLKIWKKVTFKLMIYLPQWVRILWMDFQCIQCCKCRLDCVWQRYRKCSHHTSQDKDRHTVRSDMQDFQDIPRWWHTLVDNLELCLHNSVNRNTLGIHQSHDTGNLVHKVMECMDFRLVLVQAV